MWPAFRDASTLTGATIRYQSRKCYFIVTYSKYDRDTGHSILQCPSECAGAQMAEFVTDYIVVPIGIVTVVIALSGVIYGVWTVGDKGEEDISPGRWDWRWWRWWSTSA